MIKSIKYILPFIDEISNRPHQGNLEDKLKAENLKKYMRSSLWRILYILVFCYTVFSVAIPLHTRNAVLEQELRNRDNSIKTMADKIEQQTETVRSLSNTSSTQQSRLLTKEEELRRLANALGECRDIENEYRSWLLGKGDKTTTPTNSKTITTGKQDKTKTDTKGKPVQGKPEVNKTSDDTNTPKVVLSEQTLKRLRAIE